MDLLDDPSIITMAGAKPIDPKPHSPPGDAPRLPPGLEQVFASVAQAPDAGAAPPTSLDPDAAAAPAPRPKTHVYSIDELLTIRLTADIPDMAAQLPDKGFWRKKTPEFKRKYNGKREPAPAPQQWERGERPSGRGHHRAPEPRDETLDEDPEWDTGMDGAAAFNMGSTVEDFEKWKQAMRQEDSKKSGVPPPPPNPMGEGGFFGAGPSEELELEQPKGNEVEQFFAFVKPKEPKEAPSSSPASNHAASEARSSRFSSFFSGPASASNSPQPQAPSVHPPPGLGRAASAQSVEKAGEGHSRFFGGAPPLGRSASGSSSVAPPPGLGPRQGSQGSVASLGSAPGAAPKGAPGAAPPGLGQSQNGPPGLQGPPFNGQRLPPGLQALQNQAQGQGLQQGLQGQGQGLQNQGLQNQGLQSPGQGIPGQPGQNQGQNPGLPGQGPPGHGQSQGHPGQGLHSQSHQNPPPQGHPQNHPPGHPLNLLGKSMGQSPGQGFQGLPGSPGQRPMGLPGQQSNDSFFMALLNKKESPSGSPQQAKARPSGQNQDSGPSPGPKQGQNQGPTQGSGPNQGQPSQPNPLPYHQQHPSGNPPIPPWMKQQFSRPPPMGPGPNGMPFPPHGHPMMGPAGPYGPPGMQMPNGMPPPPPGMQMPPRGMPFPPPGYMMPPGMQMRPGQGQPGQGQPGQPGQGQPGQGQPGQGQLGQGQPGQPQQQPPK
ncbi:hypothetical protein DICA4_F01398 [Diutina catenulata]